MKGHTIAFVVALMTAAALRGIASDVVEIRLRGHYFAEPATVQITVAVEPDANNRLLRIEADSGQMFRASEVELSGLGDKRIHTIEFKNLAAGAYELRAEVVSQQDKIRGMASQELVVTGGGGR